MVPKSPGLGLGGLGLGLEGLGWLVLGCRILHTSRLTVSKKISAHTTMTIDKGCIFLFGA